MMFLRFRSGSIRRQITALAIGPVILVCFLGAVTEPLTLDNYESVSAARVTALKIQMVVEQIRASETVEQKNAILSSVSKAGLPVEDVDAAELDASRQAEIPKGDIRRRVRKNLPSSFETNFRASTASGSLDNVLVVAVDPQRALAFKPSPSGPDAWISDAQVNIILEIMVVILPVLLLSFYAGCMISRPLLRFAEAAEVLKPDEGPDRPFTESGSYEIVTLGRSLNDMRSRVRRMIEDRTRMLRAISHDLRTPLTRLRLRAERSDQPDLRDAMLKDIASLSDMIEETLIYLSKEMATEKPLKSDLPSLLETVCSDFADMGFAVSYHGPDRFAYVCRPRSLARAVTNLVDNSSKFAKRISVNLSVLSDGRVRIAVVDDGPGLAANLRSRVLEPFFKVDAARGSTAKAGFGLGLSIVDDIVQAHGGTISLLNSKPHGLTAHIDLPAGDRPILPIEPSRTRAATPTPAGTMPGYRT